MVLEIKGKRVEINEEEQEIIEIIVDAMDADYNFSTDDLYLSERFKEYRDAFGTLKYALKNGFKEDAQEALAKAEGFGKFLEGKVADETTVCQHIYNYKSEDGLNEKFSKEAVDKFLILLETKLGFSFNYKNMGIKKPKLETVKRAAADKAEMPENFKNAIKNWKQIAPDMEKKYSFGDFLTDASGKGLNDGTDLSFLVSAYRTFTRYGGAMEYLKDFIHDNDGIEKTGKDIIRFVADFAHANHANNEDCVQDEAEIVNKYNNTFTDRPKMPKPKYDPNEDDFIDASRPLKILQGLRDMYPPVGKGGAPNENNRLTKEEQYEAYVALTGKNDDEIGKLKEMFGTSKGLFGGSNTAEYERASRALDEYMDARNTLKQNTEGLDVDKMNKKTVSFADFKAVSTKRKALEEALYEYVSKKTKGKDNKLGDVKIEDKTGYGAARLSSAMLLLGVLREERGSSMDVKEKRMKYVVTSTNFKKLFDEERAKKDEGRRKSSEKAIERFKQERKQKQAGEKGKAKKKGKGNMQP